VRLAELPVQEVDLRAPLGLLGRLAGATDGVTVRKARLLSELAALVRADAWLWVLQHLDPVHLDAGYYTVLEGGSSSEAQKLALMQGAFSPEIRELIEPMAAQLGGHVTWSRTQVMDDGAWYRSAFFLEHRSPSGFDDFLFSFYPLEAHVQSAVRLHRLAGRPPFGPREGSLVHAVMGAIDGLHRAQVPDAGLPSLDALSRREREVLALLLRGDSKKQIAAKLGLSLHTVGDYAKEIHRHFRVHSRGELLARFLPRDLEALNSG
jgi:DNA-binding CsgD family transcriptional regulator